MDFRDKLQLAGLSKAGLARRLGVDPDTVSRWGEEPPRYALAYLDLLLRVQAVVRDEKEASRG